MKPAKSLTIDVPTPVQERVIAALVRGATVTEAARIGGVDRTTVHYWCRSKTSFRNALARAREVHSECVRDGLRELSVAALKVIDGLLHGDNVPATAKLRAALSVLAVTGVTEALPALPPEADEAVFREICERVVEPQITSQQAHSTPENRAASR